MEHGGYYLVTEHLAKKFPQRVRDFPPDETALLAMGQGFAHAGMVPIVEIPYAKYVWQPTNLSAPPPLVLTEASRARPNFGQSCPPCKPDHPKLLVHEPFERDHQDAAAAA